MEMGLGHHVHRHVGRWLHLAVVLDLFTRKVVGWSMSERIDSRLMVDALEVAVSRQHPRAGLLAHSNRGVQYTSEHYQRTLTTHGIACSVSRRGNCWDNAPAESFFATLKKELVHHEVYELARKLARVCSSPSKCFTTANGCIRRWATCRLRDHQTLAHSAEGEKFCCGGGGFSTTRGRLDFS